MGLRNTVAIRTFGGTDTGVWFVAFMVGVLVAGNPKADTGTLSAGPWLRFRLGFKSCGREPIRRRVMWRKDVWSVQICKVTEWLMLRPTKAVRNFWLLVGPKLRVRPEQRLVESAKNAEFPAAPFVIGPHMRVVEHETYAICLHCERHAGVHIGRSCFSYHALAEEKEAREGGFRLPRWRQCTIRAWCIVRGGGAPPWQALATC
eukprot:2136934-Amphidinium_carterae.1